MSMPPGAPTRPLPPPWLLVAAAGDRLRRIRKGAGLPRKFESAGQGSVWSLASVRVAGRALIARGGADGLIRLIDAADGTEVDQIEAHRGPVRALVAIPSEDGRDPYRLASGGLDGYVRLWDLADQEGHRETRFQDEVWSLTCLMVKGEPLLAGTGAGGVVELWEPYGSTDTRTLSGTAGRVWALASIGVGGRELLAVGGNDGRVELVDPAGGTVVRSIRAHRSTVWALAPVTVSGRQLLASGGADAQVYLWDPATGAPARQYAGHLSTIRAMAVVQTEAGQRLATGSADSTIRLWNPASTVDSPEHTFSDNSGEVWALTPVVGGRGLIAGGGAEGTVFLYNPVTRQTSSLLAGSANTVWALAALDLAGHPMLASGGVEGPISLIELESRTVDRVLRGHRSTVRALSTVDGPGPELVASAGADAWVRLWDVRSGTETKELRRAHVGEVWSLASFVDGPARYVVSGGADGRIRAWRADDDSVDPVVVGNHEGEVFALATVALPDGPVVASAGSGGVQLWDARGGGRRGRFAVDGGTVWALAAYRLGAKWRVAAALSSGSVVTFDPVTYANTGDLASTTSPVRALVTVRVEARTLVVGGCQDGAIQVWEAAGRSMLARLTPHTGTVRALAVAYLDGRPQLASASDDGDVRQHDLSDLSDEGKIRVTARPTTQIASDRPSLVDTVGRGGVVDALRDFLTDPGTTPPVVVGVHGPWGHGKSSVLVQLQEQLDPQAREVTVPTHALEWRERDAAGGERWVRSTGRLTPRWVQRRLAGYAEAPDRALPARLVPLRTNVAKQITVWFSPWMYHSREELWAGLSQEIIKAVTGRLSGDDQRRLWFELNLRRSDPVAMRRRLLLAFLPRTLWGLLGTLAALATIGLGLLLEGQLIVQDKRLAALFVGLPALGLVIRLMWTMTAGSVAQVLPPGALTGPAAAGLGTGPPSGPGADPSDPLHESRAGYLYLVQHDIRQIIGLANERSPVVVFIDDLDRCSSDLISGTIEAINLFVNNAFGQCNFVIALDPAVIAAHVETTNEALLRRIAAAPVAYGTLDDVGWRFMEKIIDLPVRLPRLSAEAVAAYTGSLLVAPDPSGDGLLGSPVLAPEPVAPPEFVPGRAAVPEPAGNGARPPAGERPTTLRMPTRRRPDAADASPPEAPPAGSTAPVGVAAAGVGAAAVPVGGSGAAGSVLVAPPEPIRPPGSRRAPAPRRAGDPEPDPGGDEASRAAVAAVESIPEVSELVRLVAIGLPRRSPRQTKRFLNLWRFYLSLEHREGRLVGDRTELALTARTVAQFVEVLLRWPKYLDRLGDQGGGRPVLAALAGVADDQEQWPDELHRHGLDPADPNLEALRRLLVLTDGTRFAAVAERYL
jgi:WD40 repeat protein